MNLYPHQEKVYDLLAEGKNIILRAPTGSGKTQAAIFPFLAVMDSQSEMYGRLARKCIYSVPMRVLAKQFHTEYGESVRRYNTIYNVEIKTAIQTGDMPQDPKLERDLIFATIDQTLSSFLMAPYGLSRGRANLNLGALLSSYLVFDEFHLFDPDSTLPTTLQMLRMLKGIAPFMLMTATFSDTLITRLADLLSAEVVGLSDEDRASFAALPSQDKTRRYHTAAAPLTARTVLGAHQGRSVVICNTVDRARTMWRDLRRQADVETEVLLLHSQFLREDRDHIEDKIRARFGKGQGDVGSVIVVATQAIEVGVDITSTIMHTELAPANAIVQRAGRCARYPKNEGAVHIYRYVLDADGETVDLLEKPLPYKDHGADQMGRAWAEFRARSGDVFTFDDEQTVIDTVHAPADEAILNGLAADAGGHRASMFAAMRGDADHVGSLVREVVSQPVTIYDDPNSEAVLRNPYRLPSFNLHPGTLRKCINEWLWRYHRDPALEDDPPFGVLYLHTEADPDNSRKQLYRWEEVTYTVTINDAGEERVKTYIPYGALVVVHPALASYTAVEGLRPAQPGGWETPPDLTDRTKTWDPHQYRLETYAKHIELVYEAAFKDRRDRNHTAYWRELEWGARRLATQMNLPYETVQRAAELTVLLHDVGKLGSGWQKWVREYQAAIGRPTEPGEAYAHTDSTTEAHRVVERGMRKRPPHAVESAVGASPLLMALPESLRQAVFTAICRHHGAFTEGYQGVKLLAHAPQKVRETLLEDADVTLWDVKVVPEVPPQMFVPLKDSTVDHFFAYALFARLLRRSDSRGTMWNSPSIKGNADE